MKILIVAATRKELRPLIGKITLRKSSGVLTQGRYKNLDVDVLIAGIGMVSTTYHCAKIINKTYDAAINLGIAGSFKQEFTIGSVVNVVQDRFSELGSESKDKFLSLGELSLIGTDVIREFPRAGNRVISSLQKVRAITVNTVHGEQGSIDRVVRQFNPDIETMEGAAFLFVCKKEKMPCAQIRAVSNFVESRTIDNSMTVLKGNSLPFRLKWNIPLAVKNINEVAIKMLDAFNK